jgi:hypothetical protein
VLWEVVACQGLAGHEEHAEHLAAWMLDAVSLAQCCIHCRALYIGGCLEQLHCAAASACRSALSSARYQHVLS